MENKITTTDALLNIQHKMSDETFAKQFNFLFSKYIDIRNKDKNAFYHKLLQHLTSAGLTKEEATDFLKDIRVKNVDLIQKIEETQQKIKESTEKFEKARFDLLTNPLSAKNYLILFAETIKEINLTLDNIMNKQMLNVINKQHFTDKVNEIKKLLEHSEQNISEKLKNEKDANIDDVMLLQETKVTFNKVSEKLNELTAELAINKTLTQNLNIDKDVEKEQGQQGKEKEADNPQAPADTQAPATMESQTTESPEKSPERNTDDILVDDTAPAETESTQNLTLDQALENSLHATLNSINVEVDEKTLSFLTLSEYLHAYNNHNLNDVYKHFDKIFDKDEFKAIVLYNTALQDNAVDDLFDFVQEESFEAANIKEYAKMLKHNYPEYRTLDAEIEKELEPKPEKQKELEIGVPQRNKKSLSIDIG